MTPKHLWLSLGLRFALIVVLLVWTLSFLHRSIERPAFVQRSYCIGEGFSEQEKQMIREGAGIWDYRSPQARFVERCDHNAIQVKIPLGKDKRMIESAHDRDGFWTLGEEDTRANTVWLLTDRIDSLSQLRLIAAHEWGHVFGADDLGIEHPAIMNGMIRKDVEDNFHLYPDDITELCKRQLCQ